MKKILSALLSSLLLLSCSSMEVPFEDLYGNLLPEDFKWQEFARFNPDVKCAQSLSYINSLNSAWEQAKKEEGLTALEITTLKKSDSTDFIGTKANPGPGIEIAKMCYQWTDAKLVADLFTETATNFTSLKFYILKYNLYERNDEIEVIGNFEVNPAVYSETYIKYGKTEGRPYRACKDTEKQTLRSADLELVEDISIRIVGATGAGSTITQSDYSAYKFCADEDSPEPYPVYVIPEIPQ